MEIRYFKAAVDARAQDEKENIIFGHAAVFYQADDPGTAYDLFGDGSVEERISDTAFDRAISESHDVRALVNHDNNMLLGRVSAGTLRLSVTETGLSYEVDVPDTQVGRDTATSLQRGDLDGSSFQFRPTKVTWIEGEEGEPDVRMIDDVEMYDVGPVTFPAFEAATSGIRADETLTEVRTSWQSWKETLAPTSEEVAEEAVETCSEDDLQDEFEQEMEYDTDCEQLSETNEVSETTEDDVERSEEVSDLEEPEFDPSRLEFLKRKLEASLM